MFILCLSPCHYVFLCVCFFLKITVMSAVSGLKVRIASVHQGKPLSLVAVAENPGILCFSILCLTSS